MKLNKMTQTVLVVAALVVSSSAMALTASDPEFAGLYNTMVNWTSGNLAKALALAAFLFGAGVGIAKQTIIPAIFGVILALVLTIGPGVVTNMFSATI